MRDSPGPLGPPDTPILRSFSRSAKQQWSAAPKLPPPFMHSDDHPSILARTKASANPTALVSLTVSFENLLLGKPPALLEDLQRLTFPGFNKKHRRACAKLKGTILALKARCSKAQGASPGTGRRIMKSPVRAMQSAPPLQGFTRGIAFPRAHTLGSAIWPFQGHFRRRRFERFTLFKPPALPEVSDFKNVNCAVEPAGVCFNAKIPTGCRVLIRRIPM